MKECIGNSHSLKLGYSVVSDFGFQLYFSGVDYRQYENGMRITHPSVKFSIYH